MTNNNLIISPSPHIHGNDTVEKNMYGVIVALLPALLISFYYFGIGAMAVTAVSVLSCIAVEYLVQRFLLKGENTITDGSAIVTGLLLSLNLPSNLPLWIVVIGAVAAIGIGKMPFGGLGNNIFNPALVGRVFLLISFPVILGSIVAVNPGTGTPIDAIANGLTYALQDNIFDPGQRIEYHLFGGGAEFVAVHTGLSAIGDPVIVHDEPWYESLPLVEGAQMVIVLNQEGQLKLVRDLLLATTAPLLHVFSAGEAGLELLAGQERLRLFYWERKAWDPAHIFSDVMFDRARAINLRYAHLYGGVEENRQNEEQEWSRLDGFTRYSNVSAADYHEVRLHMMAVLGWPADGERLAPEQMELLAELEHIRWCRYHYLNSW